MIVFLFSTLVLLARGQSPDNTTESESPFNFPWLENVPKLEFTTSKPNPLFDEIKKGKIPKELIPYVNLTAVEEMKLNNISDFIIRDEDVADVSDDDETDGKRKVNTLTKDGNKTILTISDEARDDLYKHWMDQSLAGLMGAVVTDVINRRKMTRAEKKTHYACIHASKNVTAHAKCVVTVLDQLKKRNEKLKMYSTLTTKLNSHRKSNRLNNNFAFRTALGHYEKYVQSGAEEFRVKRDAGFTVFDEMENKRQAIIRNNIQTRKSYTLREQKSLSPLALIARKLTELVRAAKNTKEPAKRWQDVIQEIKDESTRIKTKKRSKDRLKRKFSKFVNAMKESGVNPDKAMKSIGLDDLFADDPILSEKEQDEKDRKEMLDKMSPDDKVLHEPIKLIREAIKIGMMMSGNRKGADEIDDKKIALLSPQFMSILPDEVANDTISLLSPSILSLHGEGSDIDRTVSLTKALQLMENTGQEEWMNFVLEASGVTETVKKMREAEEKDDEEERRRDFVDKETGQPLYFSRENVTEMYGEYEAGRLDVLEAVYKSMDDQQMEAMNKTGFAIMDDKQLERVYGVGSPYNDSEALEKFRGIPRESMPARIEENIRMIAREEMKFEISRNSVKRHNFRTNFRGAHNFRTTFAHLPPVLCWCSTTARTSHNFRAHKTPCTGGKVKIPQLLRALYGVSQLLTAGFTLSARQANLTTSARASRIFRANFVGFATSAITFDNFCKHIAFVNQLF